jgi:predicted ATP-binding protein involved in virulence
LLIESSSNQLRLRIFAGPNGSGKSTIIKSIRNAVINGRKIDIGIYINADDIAAKLLKGQFSFSPYKVKCTKRDIIDFSERSGLLTTKLDNSKHNEPYKLVNHFKKNGGKKSGI